MRSLPLSRRSVLGLAAGAALGGCRPAKRSPSAPATPDPDPALAASVRADEVAFITAYDAVMSRFPGLAADLGPLRDQHADHLAALPRPAASPQAASPAPAPAESTTALRALRAAEQAAAAARIADCLAASPTLAPLLASIGASEAAHAAALAGVRAPR